MAAAVQRARTFQFHSGRSQYSPATGPSWNPRPFVLKEHKQIPSLQQSAVQPSAGMDLTRLNNYLTWLATKLSAPDFAIATAKLWSAVDPVYAASPAGQVAQTN
jgi:hypothetical protein